MVAHERPLFDKLLWRLVTSTIFVCCWRLIARKLAELFGFNRGIRPFFAGCCFDELSRGSVLCLLNASFGKQFHNATTQFFTPEINDHGVRRGDTGRIITRRRCPVASSEALDVLNRAMRSALHWRIVMAIEMTCEGGAFVHHRCLFFLA